MSRVGWEKLVIFQKGYHCRNSCYRLVISPHVKDALYREQAHLESRILHSDDHVFECREDPEKHSLIPKLGSLRFDKIRNIIELKYLKSTWNRIRVKFLKNVRISRISITSCPLYTALHLRKAPKSKSNQRGRKSISRNYAYINRFLGHTWLFSDFSALLF